MKSTSVAANATLTIRVRFDGPGQQTNVARVSSTTPDPDETNNLAQVTVPGYRAKLERAVVVTVEAYDWNCPQHITPRFTEAEIAKAAAPLHAEVARLKEALAKAEAATGTGRVEARTT